MFKRFIYFFSFLLLNSCESFNIDPEYKGFEIKFYNSTNIEYDAYIFVGGVINGEFIPKDSINIENIEVGGNLTFPYFVDENRWKPNLNEIKNLPSDRCFFKIKLSNGREDFIYNTNSNFFSLLLPNDNQFIGQFGEIIISITDNTIYGRAVLEN